MLSEAGYELDRRFSKFVEITQSKSHYAVQGHSRSPILVPIESSFTGAQRRLKSWGGPSFGS